MTFSEKYGGRVIFRYIDKDQFSRREIMEGATASSSSTTAAAVKPTTSAGEDVNLGEINFEELIKATNVTPRLSKANTQDEGKFKLSETTPKTGGLTKIAPKPSIPTGVKTVGSSGQVVIIQSPAGTPLPIRITGTANNTQEKKGSPVTIQVMKLSDGRLVQIRNNKALNLTNLSNVTQVNVAGKKASTSATNSTIIVKSTVSSALINSAAKLQTGTTTVAASVKQSSGEIAVKTAQKNFQDSFTTNKVSNSVVTTGVVKQVAQKLVLQDKELRPKTDGDSNSKQILVPQHVLKISPSNSGPIQAIQIPGKPGLQYVRVLGTTAAGATSSTKGSTILTGIRPKDASPTKMTVIPQLIGNQKIIMATKVRPTVSISNASKEAINIASQNVAKQHSRNVITTVPTLRKVDTHIKTTTIVKDEEDPISIESTEDEKISQLNEQIKRISGNFSSNGQNSGTKTQHLMVPLELFRQMQSKEAQQLRLSSNASTRKLYSVLKPSQETFNDMLYPIKKRSPTPDGIPRRKHCNCTKSQCLKLYCDCFANGEFCQDCNCKDCYNNLEYEEDRQKAIKICLERNPNAFKPKITKARDQSDLRLHNKGCNCKRSGCLKNYCECYEAKIACSSNCKCFGCRNIEDRSELDPLEVVKIAQNFGRGVATKRPYDEIAVRPSASSHYFSPPKKPNCNFITPDVVDASIQCMLAQADECSKNHIDNTTTEKMIIEELGRCLVEIIDFSIRTTEH